MQHPREMSKLLLFADRQEDGRRLTQTLQEFKGQEAIVIAVPRGSVVVGLEIAKDLGREVDWTECLETP